MLRSELREIKSCILDILFGLAIIAITIPIWNSFDINNYQVIESFDQNIEITE